MEAAALYAYAHARRRDVVCVAHVTNSMATDGDDFEKGRDNGTDRILRLVTCIARAARVDRRRRSLSGTFTGTLRSDTTGHIRTQPDTRNGR
jgi:hypothetical protein